MNIETNCLKGDINQYFKIIKNLGEGAYGEVSLAQTLSLAKTDIDATLPDQVAIKKIEVKFQVRYYDEITSLKMLDIVPDISVHDKLTNKQHVIDEIRILKRLDIPHSIKYYGCFEPPRDHRFNMSHIYIVMEYFPHPDLWEIIKYSTKLTDVEQIEIIKQIVETIASLHDSMVAHRDLKPENILVQRNPINIRIVDYGLSCYKKEIGKCNEMVGTPGYLYPKMYDLHDFTMKQLILMDWWSFGQIAYNIFSNDINLPFTILDNYNRPTEQQLNVIPLQYRGIMKRLLDPTTLDKRPSTTDIFKGFGFPIYIGKPQQQGIKTKSRGFYASSAQVPQMQRAVIKVSKKPTLVTFQQQEEQEEQQQSHLIKPITRKPPKKYRPSMDTIVQQQQE